MQNDTCYILALIKRDDGERLLLGSGFYEFTKEQKHFNPNLFANDVVELQGADGQLLAGQVRRSTAQSFDGYIGDGTTSKQTVEQKRREFFLFFRKQHHYTVVYIMPDGTAIKRDRGYIVDAPAVQELYQVQPKWHVSLAFEDVNYYSYAEDSQGQEIYAFSADLNLASVMGGGLKWDANGAISGPTGLGDIRINGDTFQAQYTGKNVFPVNNISNNVSVTVNNDGSITVVGTTSSSLDLNATMLELNRVTNGATYSFWYEGDTLPAGAEFRAGLYNGSTWVRHLLGSGKVLTSSTKSLTGTSNTTNADRLRGQLHLAANTTINATFKVQLEKSASPTTFEKYVGGAPSPSPDFPQPVQTVTGEQTVTINGTDFPLTLKSKNLFDKNNPNLIDGQVTAQKTLDTSSGKTVMIRCQPNTEYTCTKVRSERSRAGTAKQPIGGANLLTNYRAESALLPDGRYKCTITSGPEDTYLYYTFDDSTGWDDILQTIQIEEGPTPTDFVDFVDMNFRRLGTYSDYIFRDGDDWKIHKDIKKLNLDGSEDWEFQTVAGYSPGRCRLELADNYTGSGRQPITSNRFRFDDSGQHIDGIGFTSSKWLYLYQGDIASSAPAFKTWLSSNATSAYYRLAIAADTTITDATLIAQLNAIEAAMDADGRPTAIVPTGDNLAAIITGEPNGTGGYEWEASEGGGPSFITVEGVDDALPVWHVVGPATNPTLTNSSNGLSITWNGTVPAGQELIVDMGAQTATMEGANVFQYISGSWLTLSPGTNRIAYTAANTTAGSKIYWNEIVGDRKSVV